MEMTLRERAGFWLVALLLTIGSILVLNMNAQAQTYCDTLAHDNVILNRVVNQQDALLATRLATINTLKVRVSLADSSGEAIRQQANKTIISLTNERNTATTRAAKAESKLAAIDGSQPKTWAGRQLRKGRDVLSIIGAVAVAYITLNIVL